jgi:hypothetical protein
MINSSLESARKISKDGFGDREQMPVSITLGACFPGGASIRRRPIVDKELARSGTKTICLWMKMHDIDIPSGIGTVLSRVNWAGNANGFEGSTEGFKMIV